jgi:P4 family phage/plasmid primase-like protien
MSCEYCANCKYGLDSDVCRRDLKTELQVYSKACMNFIKSKIKPKEPELMKMMGKYSDNMQLAVEMQKVTPIYYDDSRNLWLWKHKERYWKRIDETDILNAVRSDSGEYVIDSTTKREILTAIQMTGRARDVKPIPENWIHVQDQIIDYKNQNKEESIRATPDYFFTSPIPHNLGLDEDTPTIDRLFNEWVGDRAPLLYEILAYCLVEDYPIHRMFLLFGSGRNGKSQYQELITSFIGKRNTTSTELEKVIDSRFEAVKLYRKKVALIGETNFTAIKSSDRIKRLCGHDMITAEFKGKDPFDFQNTAKIIIATNSLPETLDKTEGFYSRCIIIEFNNRFDEGKPVIDLIPEIEYENLLKKCLRILSELLDRGKFTGEGTIEEKAKQYEHISNPFESFFSKELHDDENSITPMWVIYDVYKEYCLKNHFRVSSKSEVTRKMNKTEYEVKKHRFGEKTMMAVFGLTTKEPFSYEEYYGDTVGENVPDVPDVPPVSTNSPYGNLLTSGGTSGTSGTNLDKICGICGQSLNGNVENIPRLGKIHPSCKFTMMPIKALVDIPTFQGIDNISRSFKIGEIKQVPYINAIALISKKAAERAEV